MRAYCKIPETKESRLGDKGKGERLSCVSAAGLGFQRDDRVNRNFEKNLGISPAYSLRYVKENNCNNTILFIPFLK